MKSILLLFVATVSVSHGAVVASGNFKTGSPTPTLTITQDIVLVATTAGQITNLVFDEWTTSDGNLTVSTATSGTLSYSVNGGPTIAVTGNLNLWDNYHNAANSVTGNDGLLTFAGPTLAVGQTVRFFATTLTFNTNSAFTAPTAGFEGSVFAGSNTLNRITGNATIPEPSVALLLVSGAVGFFHRRRF